MGGQPGWWLSISGDARAGVRDTSMWVFHNMIPKRYWSFCNVDECLTDSIQSWVSANKVFYPVAQWWYGPPGGQARRMDDGGDPRRRRGRDGRVGQDRRPPLVHAYRTRSGERNTRVLDVLNVHPDDEAKLLSEAPLTDDRTSLPLNQLQPG